MNIEFQGAFERGAFLEPQSLQSQLISVPWMQTYAADQGLRPRVSRLIAAAASSGLTVLRVWAHSDGDGWNYMQRSVTVHRDGSGQARFQVKWDENALCGLDFVLYEAARCGVRLVLSLTNQWEEYGGLAQYSRYMGKFAALRIVMMYHQVFPVNSL